MSLKNILINSIVVAVALNAFETYAESYVFGGRAHFQGALVNQGCLMLVHTKDIRLIHFNRKFKVFPTSITECPQDVYRNINISLLDKGQPVDGGFYLKVDKAINQKNESLRHFDLVNIPGEAALYLNSDYKSVSRGLSGILISVFYP